VDYEPFFYPLDAVLRWNRIYGRHGLLQFQNVLPHESGREGMIEILKAITKSGLASFLAVIKFFRRRTFVGMMSFPKPGPMLALDFSHPARGELRSRRPAGADYARTRRTHVLRQGCPDDAEQYQAFYPQWQEFSRYVDPGFDSAFWQRVTGRRPLVD